jgi:SAM-dependent methyltransferase
MKPRILPILACPSCGGSLALERVERLEGEEVLEGTLRASCCQQLFSITRGVPRFVDTGSLAHDKAATAENFGWEWKVFNRHDERYAEQLTGWLSPVNPSFFEGKLVLEGGCGKGRHTRLAARWKAREVIAVDLSEAVDVAFDATRNLPNAHILQADLYHLPLKRAFDYAFAIGVLHHLPDPRGGFEALAAKVRPGGHLSAWVYGAENNEWITRFIDPVRRSITSRMDKRLLLQLAKLPAAAVYLASRGLYGPLSRSHLAQLGKRLFYSDYLVFLSRFGWDEQLHIVFDQLVAPTAFYVSREEFARWWQSIGIEAPQIGHHNANSWRGFGQVGG